MDLNFLKMLGISGDQQNPSVLNQMAAQGAPTPWHAPMLPAAQSPVSPWMQMSQQSQPQVTPVQQENIPQTSMPTSQPLGTAPQEMQPSQPSFMQSNPWLYAEMLSRSKPMSPDLKKMFSESDSVGAKAMDRQAEDLDTQRRLAAEYESKPERTDYRPLAAFVDSMTGSKFGPTAEALAPESPEQKMLKQLEFAKSISSGSQNLTKDQLDYIKNKIQQQSFMENRLTKEDIAKMSNATKLATSSATAGLAGQRMGMQQQRLDQQVGKEARGTVNNDPMLKIYQPRLEGAAKIGELLQSAREGKVVSNQALLGQVNAEIARLETGSQSPGLGASEKTELQDSAATLSAFKDAITGNPSDAVRPEVLNAAGKMVNELSGSYMKGIDSRMNMLRAGMSAPQQKIVNEKHESIKSTYAPRFGGWKGLGPQVGDEEGGHVFLGGNPADPKSWKEK